MTQQTLTRLRHLKLTGMADAVQQQLEQASTYEGLPFIERLSLLVEHEQLSREQRKQARLVKQARLKLQATVQEVDYQSARNLERSQVANLAQGEWLRRYLFTRTGLTASVLPGWDNLSSRCTP